MKNKIIIPLSLSILSLILIFYIMFNKIQVKTDKLILTDSLNYKKVITNTVINKARIQSSEQKIDSLSKLHSK